MIVGGKGTRTSRAGGEPRGDDAGDAESHADCSASPADADRAVGLDQAAGLLDARRRALGEADERLREIDERAVLTELSDAGRGLQESLESITAEAGFWERLEAAEEPWTARRGRTSVVFPVPGGPSRTTLRPAESPAATTSASGSSETRSTTSNLPARSG
jgi:hypothetical protein